MVTLSLLPRVEKWSLFETGWKFQPVVGADLGDCGFFGIQWSGLGHRFILVHCSPRRLNSVVGTGGGDEGGRSNPPGVSGQAIAFAKDLVDQGG